MSRLLSAISLFAGVAVLSACNYDYKGGRVDFIHSSPLQMKRDFPNCPEKSSQVRTAFASTEEGSVQLASLEAAPAGKMILTHADQTVSMATLNTKDNTQSLARALIKTEVKLDPATQKLTPTSYIACREMVDVKEAQVDFSSAPQPLVISLVDKKLEAGFVHVITLFNRKLSQKHDIVVVEPDEMTKTMTAPEARSESQKKENKIYRIDEKTVGIKTEVDQVVSNVDEKGKGTRIFIHTRTEAIYRLQ